MDPPTIIPDDDREHRDAQRDLGAVNATGEDVASELIGAEMETSATAFGRS